MFCSECGTRSTGGRFCGFCGSPMAHGGQPTEFTPRSGSAAGTPYGSPAADLSAVAPVLGRNPPGNHVWDYIRDLGAAGTLIWSLTLYWSSTAKASSVVYVLLSTLSALLALTVLPLSRLLRKPDGSPLVWPTLAIRWLLCAPFAIVVLITVVRDLTGELPGLGPALVVGAFGLAVALVPRDTEIHRAANGPALLRGFRLACGWFGGLGMAAIVISTLIANPPDGWFEYDNYFLLSVLPFLAVIGLFVAVYGVTALRVAAGKVSWQPTLVWLGAGLLVSVGIDASNSTVESSHQGFYGAWLLLAATGLAAGPLVGGKDGDRSEVGFWALVVANAFRIIIVFASIVLLLAVLVLVQFSQYRYSTTVSGQMVWGIVSTVLTIGAAAVGSNRLRADAASGRQVALVSVAVMVLLRIIDLVVLGTGSFGAGGAPVSLLLLAGTFGVIVYGLTVPAPMRRGPQPGGGSPAAGGVAAPVPFGRAPETEQVAVPPSTGWIGAGTEVVTPVERPPVGASSAAAATEQVTVPPSTGWIGGVTEVATTVGQQQPPVVDPVARAAADPATPLAELMSIAGVRADLRPLVAANPSTYPDLLQWLAGLNEPAVNQALAARFGPAPR